MSQQKESSGPIPVVPSAGRMRSVFVAGPGQLPPGFVLSTVIPVAGLFLLMIECDGRQCGYETPLIILLLGIATITGAWILFRWSGPPAGYDAIAGRMTRADLTPLLGRESNAVRFGVPYVRQVLVPTLRPGDFVILDNLSCHKRVEARAAIEAVGPGATFYRRTARTSTRSSRRLRR
jgi:hypothetical protein